jgi:hypothetical protein
MPDDPSRGDRVTSRFWLRIQPHDPRASQYGTSDLDGDRADRPLPHRRPPWREYRPSSEANTAPVMSGGKDLGPTELQSGLKKNMTTAFEMPQMVAKGVFTLVIAEKGVLGAGSVRITLK